MIEVSLVASGFGLTREDIKGSISWWKDRGVKLSRVKGVGFKKDILSASSLESRALELKKAFSLQTPGEIVWALRGGYGMQEILPYLKKTDFKARKIYVGFSDGTSLHYYLNKVLGQASVHGPHANAAFQNLSPSKINNDMSRLLESPDVYSDVFEGLKQVNKSTKSEVSGVLIGGNLTTLVSILGTDFDKGAAGDILFLEEVEEPAYKINRLLTHLEQAGFLKKVKAVVFGHMSHSSKAQENLIEKVMLRWAKKQIFPVLSGFQAGHIHKKNKPFWLGKKSKLLLDAKPRLLNNV